MSTGSAARASDANAWRRTYRRAPDATQGLQTPPLVTAAMRAFDRKRRSEQDRFLRKNGFVGTDAELGNELVIALRRRQHRFPLSHLARRIAGQLVAAGEWNFQGVSRIASLVGCHRRTVQRARKELERYGLLESVLLHAGDKLPSQRAPVWRLQVVRDVREARRLVPRGARLTYDESMRHREPQRPPSAAERPAPPIAPMTSAQYFALATRAAHNGDSALAALHTSTAVALRKREQAAPAAPVDEPQRIRAPRGPPDPLAR
jgi:hypothetical protein